ncbi:glycosyltransferase [Nocardia transvalensis]|uniref:glycosyltransferase n=1 Tax=Nocardia transvalensis TaxID=37333 RepID=UPI0018956DD8|nr:glycosyltransferase [Nocardia transvalensis]MBF6333493.1 glycosyltransferase family 4 protein [Nocardia transvalensis]
MRILMIGPTGPQGSLPPYLTVLTAALREYGVRVDRLGSTGVPYDPARGGFWPVDRIVAAAQALLDQVDLQAYDVISLHAGTLEIEQVLPVLWRAHRHPPVVAHLHCLTPTLFSSHVPDPGLHAAVTEAVPDAVVCFGEYARRRHAQLHGALPSLVSWLPTTIPPGTLGRVPPTLQPALAGRTTTASCYGYAAPWKDPAGLVAAADRTRHRCRIVLAGPFWDDPAQTGIDLSAEIRGPVVHGAAEVAVVPTYLDPAHRLALVAVTNVAVFPYRPHLAFQGSGAVADYLARGVPVLATEIANFAELVGDAGLLVPAGDRDLFAAALDELTGDRACRHRLARAAAARAHRFTAGHHAVQCLRLYESVTARRRTAS